MFPTECQLPSKVPSSTSLAARREERRRTGNGDEEERRDRKGEGERSLCPTGMRAGVDGRRDGEIGAEGHAAKEGERRAQCLLTPTNLVRTYFAVKFQVFF